MTDDDRTMMKPGEVARLWDVDPKTVTRWAAEGRIPCVRTPGGHRRYPVAAILAMLRGEKP
jgi:excisionase family DNA binding protein